MKNKDREDNWPTILAGQKSVRGIDERVLRYLNEQQEWRKEFELLFCEDPNRSSFLNTRLLVAELVGGAKSPIGDGSV